nr:DUF3459 domain-containing protein [Gemmatimonadota bacterium]NIQ56643.1 DUF3459 domain-containing protein [Gemmatimonadota bacterium]NIU78600.1 DUF3459 domain-containing protein [Gammaproteobacteria bacterium]NIX45222.1 DUF3459 domain-containing protein [Gemmatimonadota bacterium]NIY09479.1 DUF3459 domain-containing protein [Gemmatimonadota bacterium]
PHAETLALYRDLIRVRRAEPALRPGSARTRVTTDRDAGWIGVAYERPGAADLVAALNFSDSGNAAHIPAAPGTWRRRITTDDPCYGGDGGTAERIDVDADGGLGLELPARTAVLYRREGD